MKKKNRYAILGVAGFVAKRHINVLKILKCDLIMASDLHDNVGFLDNSFPNCIFYKNENKFFSDLKKINFGLWEIEDKIRIKDSKNEFDQEFIDLAKSVYKENDKRATLKKEINLKYGSFLIEEKSYKG